MADGITKQELDEELVALIDRSAERAEEAFRAGNERKQEFVDALIAKDMEASIDETWDTLFDKMAMVIRATGNATVADVLTGKTFSNAMGNGLEGMMQNWGAGGVVMPGTVNQTKPAGYYSSPITVLGDADLVPSNIRSGVDLFGVVGSLVEGTPFAENVENYAMLGNKSDLDDVLIVDRTGLFNFTPKRVYVKVNYSSSRYNDGSGNGHGPGRDTLIGPFRAAVEYKTIGALDWECTIRVDITTNGLKFYKRMRYKGEFTTVDSFRLLGFMVFG